MKKRTKTKLSEATPKEWDDITFVCPEDSTRGNTKKLWRGLTTRFKILYIITKVILSASKVLRLC